MGREVGHHRTQSGAQSTHVGRNGAAARSRRFAGGLLGEARAGHVDKTFGAVVGLEQIFDDLLVGIEGLQVVEPHRLDGDADDFTLRDTRRALLLAQEVLAGLDQRALGHQADNLGAGDSNAAGIGLAAYLVESYVERRDRDVGDVHRNLGDAVLFDEPADGLRRLERAGLHERIAMLVLERLAHGRTALADGTALFAHVERNGVGTARRGGIEVEVDGDEEVAGADRRRTRMGHTLVEGTGAEVGSRLFVGQLLGQRLILAGTADGQVLPLGFQGGSLVAVGRNMQLVGNAARQSARQLGTLLERDARNGDERQHVGGAHARMGAVVIAHVDKFRGAFHTGKGSLEHGFGLADEGHHHTVGRLAGVHVEQLDPFDRLDGRGNLVNYSLVASLAEIGNAFYDTFLHIRKF